VSTVTLRTPSPPHRPTRRARRPCAGRPRSERTAVPAREPEGRPRSTRRVAGAVGGRSFGRFVGMLIARCVVSGRRRDDARAPLVRGGEHPRVAREMHLRRRNTRCEAAEQRQRVEVDGDGAIFERPPQSDADEPIGEELDPFLAKPAPARVPRSPRRRPRARARRRSRRRGRESAAPGCALLARGRPRRYPKDASRELSSRECRWAERLLQREPHCSQSAGTSWAGFSNTTTQCPAP
jgi:hypothetical protein